MSNEKQENKRTSRREFIQKSMRIGLGVGLTAVGGLAAFRVHAEDSVWQLDPFKCVACGRCADYCVMTPSAVKCVHAFDLCGYCDLCGGYLKPNSNARSTAAENQLCPTSAIRRKFVEEPYFEYEIEEDLCIGCGVCVKGCTAFGNGSLHLQVRHNLCVNCNECSIARVCPADAFQRVPASSPYLIKGEWTKDSKNKKQPPTE
ncbi:4Fe-4S dicluster domain-containing protein [Mangrovibacterium diazotrophicum]|uniref:Electron transport complex protein RnfB n=1 Tax=Mangrovibacterium diazotrophicum TaxID=1261403 RepID=A0A419W3B3_9BACT|nr:ferredoxin [Mangrovibacterium diazotrophicum]RKD89966.1 electron transport complex protein RnfB [Mangrovibacterium diazotrophicum]